MSIPSPFRILDGSPTRTTGGKTKVIAFRIMETQIQQLKINYSGNSSALVRILLQKFLNGELPSVQAEYESLIQTPRGS